MKRPNAASLLLLLASGALLIAASPRLHSNAVTIDRAFLAVITGVGPDRGPAWDAAGDVLWKNYNELVYLHNTGDPEAIRAVQHLFVVHGVPGGCSCSLGQLADTLFSSGSLPIGFLDQLRTLTPEDQARILGVIDCEFQHAPDAAYEGWSDDRAAYLAANPSVARVYTRPDFDPPPEAGGATSSTDSEPAPARS